MRFNLVPESIRLRQRRRARIRMWGMVLTAATAALAIPVGWDWSRQAKAERLLEQSVKLNRTRSLMRVEWDSIKTEVQATQAQIERADALRSKRAWSAMLALIAREVPPNVWLTSVATDPAQPPKHAVRPASTATAEQIAASITIDGPGTINIQGFAPHAEDPIILVSNLKSSGAFHTVVLRRSSLEPVNDGFYFRFDVVCEW